MRLIFLTGASPQHSTHDMRSKQARGGTVGRPPSPFFGGGVPGEQIDDQRPMPICELRFRLRLGRRAILPERHYPKDVCGMVLPCTRIVNQSKCLPQPFRHARVF